MKKYLSKFSVLIIIVALAFTNCRSEEKKEIEIPDEKPIVSKNTVCSDYPEGTISELPIGLIQDMLSGYRTNQLKKINNGLKMDDAKAISFDLETLKQFIYHIEAISKAQDNSLEDKDLGVRIYYAAYPEKSEWENPNYKKALDIFKGDPITEQYGKRHTLLILPTIKRGDTYYDFNPKDRSTYEAGIRNVMLQQIQQKKQIQQSDDDYDYNNPRNSIMSLSTVSEQGTIAQNHGGLYPPYNDAGLGF